MHQSANNKEESIKGASILVLLAVKNEEMFSPGWNEESVFWDAKGIIMIDYLWKRASII